MVNLQPHEDIEMDSRVGRRVSMLMWDRKLTQSELGQMIGMDQSSVGKRLRGERPWTVNQLAAVCIALKTTLSYLLGEIEDPDLNPRELWDRTRRDYDWAPWNSKPRSMDYKSVGLVPKGHVTAMSPRPLVSIDQARSIRELVRA